MAAIPSRDLTFTLLLDWLDAGSLFAFDKAIIGHSYANVSQLPVNCLQSSWLRSLRHSTSVAATKELECDKTIILWLMERGVSTQTIKIERSSAIEIEDTTFQGICISHSSTITQIKIFQSTE